VTDAVAALELESTIYDFCLIHLPFLFRYCMCTVLYRTPSFGTSFTNELTEIEGCHQLSGERRDQITLPVRTVIEVRVASSGFTRMARRCPME
jgi:hypothetical protein